MDSNFFTIIISIIGLFFCLKYKLTQDEKIRVLLDSLKSAKTRNEDLIKTDERRIKFIRELIKQHTILFDLAKKNGLDTNLVKKINGIVISEDGDIIPFIENDSTGVWTGE